jgi:hypothetical protein
MSEQNQHIKTLMMSGKPVRDGAEAAKLYAQAASTTALFTA